ncbi:MAG: hypothetical protein IH987_18725, partial [Planctomycetes bacterium]|nr:hypothetical protein [Planctomycetota bacterium]
MYTKHSCARTAFFVSLVGLSVPLAGCNVDGLWADGQAARRAQRASLQGREVSDDVIDISVADTQEVDLVEQLVMHRLAYRRTLANLRAYYEQHGYSHKELWASYEMDGLVSVKMFRYLMDAEIPSEDLRAQSSIPDADGLYEKGLALMRQGGHGVPVLYRQDKMVEAAKVFRTLIEDYPQSDKIDDAAFMCGEIHKEYLPGQERIAVRWYERAWTWNPQTPHAARFQAAVVYDYRLHDRDRALELYQAVLKDEVGDKSNVRFATRRIHELTTGDRSARTGRSPRK